jgi:hypothetical protein
VCVCVVCVWCVCVWCVCVVCVCGVYVCVYVCVCVCVCGLCVCVCVWCVCVVCVCVCMIWNIKEIIEATCTVQRWKKMEISETLFGAYSVYFCGIWIYTNVKSFILLRCCSGEPFVWNLLAEFCRLSLSTTKFFEQSRISLEPSTKFLNEHVALRNARCCRVTNTKVRKLWHWNYE